MLRLRPYTHHTHPRTLLISFPSMASLSLPPLIAALLSLAVVTFGLEVTIPTTTRNQTDPGRRKMELGVLLVAVRQDHIQYEVQGRVL